MSDARPNGPRGTFQPVHGRRRAHRPISIEGPPTAEELAQQPHKGDDADRFSLYTPEQIEMDTATVQLRLTFDEPIHVRDQAEMIIAACQIIIDITRKRDLGSIRQRIEARREARSLSKALVRFNGGYPRGVWKPKPRDP